MSKVDNNVKLDFSDVLIKPRISESKLTRKDIDLNVDYGYFKGVPIVITEMVSTGTYNMARALEGTNIITFIHKEHTVQEHTKNLMNFKDLSNIGLSTGCGKNDIKKLKAVLDIFPDVGFINIHIANAYANVEGLCELIADLKANYDIPVAAGVVATADIAEVLANAGVDIIRVGVGSGSACKTRSEVGVGVPQLSALMEVKEVADRYDCRVLSCGGVTNAGDVAKAMGAGADFVILGGMISKSEECDNIVEVDGKKYVNFYGLGSAKQYSKHGISEKEYRPDEGRNLMIPVEGSVHKVINQVKGGLRSACTYVGAKTLEELYDKTTFVKVNHQINTTLAKYENSSN
jgi:GMP reductase